MSTAVDTPETPAEVSAEDGAESIIRPITEQTTVEATLNTSELLSTITRHLKLIPEQVAEAIRDQVNSVCPGRLRIDHLLKGGEDGRRVIIFFTDADAPTEFWDGIEGARMQVEFDCDNHRIDDAVATIINCAPQGV